MRRTPKKDHEALLLRVLNNYEPQQLAKILYLFYSMRTAANKLVPLILDYFDYSDDFKKPIDLSS